MPKIVLLWTDIALWLMALGRWPTPGTCAAVRRCAHLGRVARDTPAMCSAVILAAFVIVGLLDSVHYRPLLPPAPARRRRPAYAPVVRSALDGCWTAAC